LQGKEKEKLQERDALKERMTLADKEIEGARLERRKVAMEMKDVMF
jgi:hypothetical protein